MIRRVVPNISTHVLEDSTRFYVELFGLEVAMDMGWIVTLRSPSNETAQISLLQNDERNVPSRDLTISIEVDDVDAVHQRASAKGYHVVYPLTSEEWGVRRFHVLDPNGIVINVMVHYA